jgi:uncharacterized repeat protein (TIGR01451 family)
MNGALAQADLLGIFGREGLDLATLWEPPDFNQPVAHAFRMYLNYDGLGSGFGDTRVQAVSTDQELLAIYAAQRSADEALTLMVINKSGQALTSNVSVVNFTLPASAQVYRYSHANLSTIVREADQPVTTNDFTASFPADSITLMVLAPPDQPDLSPSAKEAGQPSAFLGETLTYTIQVINQGSALTDTVSLTDTIPSGLAYVPGSLTATTGIIEDADAPILSWTGVLTPTPTVTLTYTVTVTSNLPQAITNSVLITSPGLPSVTRSTLVIINGRLVYLPHIRR